MKQNNFFTFHEQSNIPLFNTKILFSKLYLYSPEKFYLLFKLSLNQYNINLRPSLNYSNHDESILELAQPSFKFVFETKLNNMFALPTLQHHLSAFKNEEYQALITLGVMKIDPSISSEFKLIINEYNEIHGTNIIHLDFTYSFIIEKFFGIIHKDDPFYDIVTEYKNFCISMELICDPFPQ